MSTSISFTWLGKDKYFVMLFMKLTKGEQLSSYEYSYILSCAIIFLKEYSRDKRKSTNFEFSYFIILKYSIKTGDYNPLFDLSTSFGFYPISKYILDNELISQENLQSFLIDNQLERFKYKNITETFEQNKFRKEMISSEEQDNSYVAPTSFGKSSLIIDIIENLKTNKIAIIVPTKSLLTQTYRMVSDAFKNKKIIFHDEMYDNEDEFIAVFTQERALRLLKDNTVFFDVLIIDEAHNIFGKSHRSILLSRLIRKNRIRNSQSKVFYFSPLITDSKNLQTDNDQNIFERKIELNIKAPDIFEYRLNGFSYLYNRFLNDFYPLDEHDTFIDYIIKNQCNKNFLYLRTPRKVEQLTYKLSKELNYTENEKLRSLSDILSKNVHDEFYCVDYVKKGILYLHGKLPDLVKEYLEYKFKTIDELTFIVANSVILEGVNLPVDNLYIMNTYSLGGKGLTNLIGRVNRLNDVFSGSSHSLNKLIPKVHFVNTEYFNRKNSNMSKKIELLKSSFFPDEIKNPTLLSYDFEKHLDFIEKTKNIESRIKEENTLGKALEIRDREDFLVTIGHLPENRLRAAFIEAGLFAEYRNPDAVIEIISERRDKLITQYNWSEIDVITKVYHVFIEDLDNEFLNLSFARLKNEKARNFYNAFVKNTHMLTLKEHINSIVKYFHSIKNQQSGKEFYIGTSYGEIPKSTENSVYYGSLAYLDLSSKSQKELVNLALVKLKIESDFVSYTLNQYVSLLKELELINEDEYNKFIYGTTIKRNTEFTKLGLSGSLIYKLEGDNQLQNIEIDDLGHVKANAEFKSYLLKQDDLMQFEIHKYITI
ncbi:MAG: DEAD/DEAH box helicase [Psychrobium sp.]|nr:DEAD/DEAH box helicase [Psychrobium sp.]